MKRVVHLLVAIVAVIWLCAPSAVVVRAQDTPATAPVFPLEEPSTMPFGLADEQLGELGRNIEQAVTRRETRAFVSFIDFEALFQTATEGMHLTSDLLVGVRRGFDDASGGFVQSVIRSMDKGGAYRYLRFTRTENGARLLFRMSGPNLLNYHELIVGHNRLGFVKVLDVYNMAAGEPISSTLRRMLEIAMAQQGKAHALKDPQGSVRSAVARMSQLLNERKGREMLERFDALPKSTQSELMVQLLRLRAALAVGEAELERAIREYRSIYPQDPAADLYLADVYLLRGEYDKAAEAVERLDAAVGGDPFLHTYRSNIALAKGDLEKAHAEALKAADADPGNFVVQHQLLLVALHRKDHAETLRLLRLIHAEYKMEFGDLTKNPRFAEFVKSNEYRQWRTGGAGSEAGASSATTRPGFKF